MFVDTKREGEVIVEDYSKYFKAAAQILRKNGHCKNHAHNSDGQFCLVGAIAEAVNSINASGHVINIMSISLAQSMSHLSQFSGIANLTNWNDAPDRTADDVINLLDIAALLRRMKCFLKIKKKAK